MPLLAIICNVTPYIIVIIIMQKDRCVFRSAYYPARAYVTLSGHNRTIIYRRFFWRPYCFRFNARWPCTRNLSFGHRRRVPLEVRLPTLPLTETDNIHNVSGRGTLRFGIACHDHHLTRWTSDGQRRTSAMTKSPQAAHTKLISHKELPTGSHRIYFAVRLMHISRLLLHSSLWT